MEEAMSTTTQETGSGPTRPAVLPTPPLQNGDHLTAREFERRFDAMPEVKKAELIDGVVYMGSPVSMDYHGQPDADVGAWLGVYKAFTPGTQAGHNATVRLDGKNQPQPDVLMRILPEYGGRTTTVDTYVVGGPELTTEISASSVSFDLHAKLQAYWRHGVQEYVVWRVWDRAIDWFVRGETQFTPLPAEGGVCKSRVFPGLWLDAAAMIDGNMAQVLAVLQKGLATPEHAAFCNELLRRRGDAPAGS
jgi:Putative restriction endonuclease